VSLDNPINHRMQLIEIILDAVTTLSLVCNTASLKQNTDIYWFATDE